MKLNTDDCDIHTTPNFAAATIEGEGFKKLIAFSKKPVDTTDWDWVCLEYRQRSRSNKRKGRK